MESQTIILCINVYTFLLVVDNDNNLRIVRGSQTKELHYFLDYITYSHMSMWLIEMGS